MYDSDSNSMTAVWLSVGYLNIVGCCTEFPTGVLWLLILVFVLGGGTKLPLYYSMKWERPGILLASPIQLKTCVHTRQVPLPTLSLQWEWNYAHKTSSPTHFVTYSGNEIMWGGGSKGSLRTSIPWDIHLCGWSYVKGHSPFLLWRHLLLIQG